MAYLEIHKDKLLPFPLLRAKQFSKRYIHEYIPPFLPHLITRMHIGVPNVHGPSTTTHPHPNTHTHTHVICPSYIITHVYKPWYDVSNYLALVKAQLGKDSLLLCSSDSSSDPQQGRVKTKPKKKNSTSFSVRFFSGARFGPYENNTSNLSSLAFRLAATSQASQSDDTSVGTVCSGAAHHRGPHRVPRGVLSKH